MLLSRPVLWLRLALGFVIGLASLLLLLRAHQGPVHGGIHPAVVTALAAVELLAVILFLIPKTLPLGARLLLCVLLAAALLHLHSGETPPPTFLVYAAAIWVVLADARERARRTP